MKPWPRRILKLIKIKTNDDAKMANMLHSNGSMINKLLFKNIYRVRALTIYAVGGLENIETIFNVYLVLRDFHC